jgi:enoyl-CoA hydratase/carnithine racemase
MLDNHASTHAQAVGRLVLQFGAGDAGRLTRSSLEAKLSQLMNDPGAAGCITLQGDPGVFCEGLDLALISDGTRSERERLHEASRGLDALARLLSKLATSTQTVVALVDGSSLGGGMGLLGAADLVLATPRSRFALPESLVGLIPAVVFPWIARRIGVSRTQRLALGAKPLTAHEALSCGLVDEVVDDLESSFLRHQRRLACVDPRAVAAMKQLTAQYLHGHEDYQEAARARFLELFSSPSTQRRMARFVAGLAPWSDADPESDT